MTTTTMFIRKFDINKFASPLAFNVLIVGKRATGRTTLAKDLLYQIRNKCKSGVVIDPFTANEYLHVTPADITTYNEYSPTIINDTINAQKEYLCDCRRDNVDASYNFVVLDDVVHLLKNQLNLNNPLNDIEFRGFFMNHRHIKTNLINILSNPSGIYHPFNVNIDYIFLLHNSIDVERKRLYDTFCAGLFTFEKFCQFFDECTKEPYSCMVIDCTIHPTNPDDHIFWYKAEQHDGLSG